jgi:hypothetical protein
MTLAADQLDAVLADARTLYQEADDAVLYEMTELGNARRLLTAHGMDIRFVAEWRKSFGTALTGSST